MNISTWRAASANGQRQVSCQKMPCLHLLPDLSWSAESRRVSWFVKWKGQMRWAARHDTTLSSMAVRALFLCFAWLGRVKCSRVWRQAGPSPRWGLQVGYATEHGFQDWNAIQCRLCLPSMPSHDHFFLLLSFFFFFFFFSRQINRTAH